MHKHTTPAPNPSFDMTGFVPIPGLAGYFVHPDGCVVSVKKEGPRILTEQHGNGSSPVWWRIKIGKHEVRIRDLVYIVFGDTTEFEKRAEQWALENYIHAALLEVHEADVARAPEILDAILAGRLTDEMLDTVCELPGGMVKTWRHLTVAEVVFLAGEHGFNSGHFADILKTSGAYTLEGYLSFVANVQSEDAA